MEIKIISEHKKNRGAQGLGYKWTKPAEGMKRVQAIINGVTRHIDVKK